MSKDFDSFSLKHEFNDIISQKNINQEKNKFERDQQKNLIFDKESQKYDDDFFDKKIDL